MDPRDASHRRPQQQREVEHRTNRTRLAAAASLLAVVVITGAIVLSSTGGSNSHPGKSGAARTTRTSTSAARPGTAAAPILTYQVINAAPAQTGASSGLYVPAAEFSAQMEALKAAGWHAVTLDQLQANWARGTPLPAGRPIVITFDGGFASQYTNALPVLKRLGWVAVVNLPATGRSPADGGMTDAQTRGLLAAGWQLGAAGNSQNDLTGLSPQQLTAEVTGARQTLRTRYGVAVNWFSYPSGGYDPTVTAAVRTAGYVGATTLVTGWANPQDSRFRLPRLRVAAGTTPTALASQIAAAKGLAPPPLAQPIG